MKHTEGEWEDRKMGRQPSHSGLETKGGRTFQEARAWSALLRAARGQGLGEAFGSYACVQLVVRNSRKAEAVVVLRLSSDCRTYELLHDIVGDRMRMAVKKGN